MEQKIIDRVGEEWGKVIGQEFSKPYMAETIAVIKKSRAIVNVYPDGDNVFRAFRETPLDKVRVVWLGQDPYNNPPGQATGLAMDCGVQVSQTMKQILYAYDQCYPTQFNTDVMDGKLLPWAKQGVFLLNTALTVEEGKAKSHSKIWEKFMAAVMEALIRHQNPKVFVMLGRDAQRYSKWVTAPHVVVEREHPVAASYDDRKWLHGNIFNVINSELKKAGHGQIDW